MALDSKRQLSRYGRSGQTAVRCAVLQRCLAVELLGSQQRTLRPVGALPTGHNRLKSEPCTPGLCACPVQECVCRLKRVCNCCSQYNSDHECCSMHRVLLPVCGSDRLYRDVGAGHLAHHFHVLAGKGVGLLRIAAEPVNLVSNDQTVGPIAFRFSCIRVCIPHHSCPRSCASFRTWCQ